VASDNPHRPTDTPHPPPEHRPERSNAERLKEIDGERNTAPDAGKHPNAENHGKWRDLAVAGGIAVGAVISAVHGNWSDAAQKARDALEAPAEGVVNARKGRDDAQASIDADQKIKENGEQHPE